MSGIVPRQCAVCGITRHLFPCPTCRCTTYCSDLCLDADQPFHRPMCFHFRLLRANPNPRRLARSHLVFVFPADGPHPSPAWVLFGSGNTLTSDPSVPSDIHLRTLLGPGPWHTRDVITQNRLAEDWLLDRELTVYAPVHTAQLPVNRALVDVLAAGGHVCDEEAWRGPFVVVAGQRSPGAGVPRRPDAGSATAVVDDVTGWDYRQVVNYAVRPTGLPGDGNVVWIPRWPGGGVIELEAEDAEFGEGDCDGVEGIGEGFEVVERPSSGEEGSWDMGDVEEE